MSAESYTWLLLVLLPLWHILPAVAKVVNDRPIIGILTQPLSLGLQDKVLGHHAPQSTYIAASYVKFVESAGARVVPLHFDAPDEELRMQFRQINGILFPGGGTKLTDYYHNRFRQAAQLLWGLALNATAAGDYFPIHGTCLGFQLVTIMAAFDDSVLCEYCYQTFGLPLPLVFTASAGSSKLLSDIPGALMKALATQNLTENSHHDGIAPEMFHKNENLRDFFDVLSTNVDPRGGRQFVSTIEARSFPITATQWHPEKNNFEWGSSGQLGYDAIPHSADAVLVSQYVANHFVNQARQNFHRFVTQAAEAEALIYNYDPVQVPGGWFAQIYVWKHGYPPAGKPVVI